MKIIAVEIDDFDNGKYVARCAAECHDMVDRMVFRRVVETHEIIIQGYVSGKPIFG